MLFGTSGIRGLYGSEVNEELSIKVGRAFADNDVVIGRDTRKTGVSLFHAVASGVVSGGKDAIYAGIVPTPTLALITRILGTNGIMITASHNPEEYNGLKLFSKGYEISRDWEKSIEKRIRDGVPPCQWNKAGRVKEYKEGVANHKKLIKKMVGDIKGDERVLIDPNGAGGVITPELFTDLGVKTETINGDLEGFKRGSEPSEENLKLSAEVVKKYDFDFGIAHDGDADRARIIDKKGVVPQDIQLAIFFEYFEKGPFVSTVEASLLVRETIKRLGERLIITPVGSLYVSQEVKKSGAGFGGEPAGEYIFPKGVPVPDGIATAAYAIKIFEEKGKFEELRKRYKEYPILREKFRTKDKEKAMEQIKGRIKKEFGKVWEIDGVRVDEKDGWFLIRASGTEPVIRLTIEYKTREKLRKTKEELDRIIEESLVN